MIKRDNLNLFQRSIKIIVAALLAPFDAVSLQVSSELVTSFSFILSQFSESGFSAIFLCIDVPNCELCNAFEEVSEKNRKKLFIFK